MSDPLAERDLEADALELVAKAAGPYLAAIPERLAHDVSTLALLDGLGGALPEQGDGTMASVEQLLRVGLEASTLSTGPRFFHFVVGGTTPAARAGDWIASLLDQNAGNWATSPLATKAEDVVLAWLKELLGLPATHGGVLTPSATFANLTGLACARHWWAERHGVDVAADGLFGLPRMPVLSSGYVHTSARKALQILGCGRDSVETFARDDAGRLDLKAMEARLAALDGPAVIIGNAGEVNAGDFDPIADLAELAETYGAWLHIDGAFGIFAALSPQTAHLVAGVERADSISADGHKWMNVPYESGFAFTRDPSILGKTFGVWAAAPYLPGAQDPHTNYNNLGPESSRRARAFPLWASLRAYGREGYRAVAERHRSLVLHLEQLVNDSPDLELLAPAGFCVVCFRARPDGVPEPSLDDLNQRLGEEIRRDGRFQVGTTRYRGMTALRPAIVNWQTQKPDLDLFVSVIGELLPRVQAAE